MGELDYIVSLLGNESETRKEYILNNFYIPINLIEFKIEERDIKSAFEIARVDLLILLIRLRKLISKY